VRLVILYCDDERLILNMFAKMVAPRHDVILCSNGDEALEHWLSDEQVDVGLLDMMLGEGPSGFEILRKLRQEAPARLERLIIVTGARGIPGIEEELENYRIPTTGERLPVIDKPFNMAALERTFAKYGVSPAPRGPRYDRVPKPPDTIPRGFMPPMRQPHQSRPNLIDDEMDEISVVTAMAERAHDPKTKTGPVEAVAAAVVDIRKRLGDIEPHFENNPSTKKKGMVWEMYELFEFVKKSMNFWPKFLAGAFGVLVALGTIATWWLAAHQTQPKDVARELQRMQREEQQAPAPAK
jgi:CheY-like chemotaxis protein